MRTFCRIAPPSNGREVSPRSRPNSGDRLAIRTTTPGAKRVRVQDPHRARQQVLRQIRLRVACGSAERLRREWVARRQRVPGHQRLEVLEERHRGDSGAREVDYRVTVPLVPPTIGTSVPRSRSVTGYRRPATASSRHEPITRTVGLAVTPSRRDQPRVRLLRRHR